MHRPRPYLIELSAKIFNCGWDSLMDAFAYGREDEMHGLGKVASAYSLLRWWWRWG